MRGWCCPGLHTQRHVSITPCVQRLYSRRHRHVLWYDHAGVLALPNANARTVYLGSAHLYLPPRERKGSEESAVALGLMKGWKEHHPDRESRLLPSSPVTPRNQYTI